MKGFVDVGLIQEHFKKTGAPLFDLFGPSWWNVSSGAVGESMGRRSGGCAIFGQPSLQTCQGLQHKSGRICGLFTQGGPSSSKGLTHHIQAWMVVCLPV